MLFLRRTHWYSGKTIVSCVKKIEVPKPAILIMPPACQAVRDRQECLSYYEYVSHSWLTQVAGNDIMRITVLKLDAAAD